MSRISLSAVLSNCSKYLCSMYLSMVTCRVKIPWDYLIRAGDTPVLRLLPHPVLAKNAKKGRLFKNPNKQGFTILFGKASACLCVCVCVCVRAQRSTLLCVPGCQQPGFRNEQSIAWSSFFTTFHDILNTCRTFTSQLYRQNIIGCSLSALLWHGIYSSNSFPPIIPLWLGNHCICWKHNVFMHSGCN